MGAEYLADGVPALQGEAQVPVRGEIADSGAAHNRGGSMQKEALRWD